MDIANNPIVTIIIPCYNVDKYIEKCISSIEKQTYSYLEIIPVNDGSPDKTPQILNELAKRDSRIKVLHKHNEGVSAARNSGLDIATGDYVIFVDGDDYLAPDYVDYMLLLAKKDDADFVLSKNWYVRDSQHQIVKDHIETFSPSQATALLLSPRIIVGCCNKMYKKRFLDNNHLRFSTSLFYGEGLHFITKAAQLSNKVTMGERLVYYYRKNNESSATTKFKIKNYQNGELAIDTIAEELLIKDAEIELMLSLHKSLFCMNALSHTYSQKLNKQYISDCQHWKSEILKYLPKLLISKKVSLYRKVLLSLGSISPKLYSKLNNWNRKRIAKQSVG